MAYESMLRRFMPSLLQMGMQRKMQMEAEARRREDPLYQAQVRRAQAYDPEFERQKAENEMQYRQGMLAQQESAREALAAQQAAGRTIVPFMQRDMPDIFQQGVGPTREAAQMQEVAAAYPKEMLGSYLDAIKSKRTQANAMEKAQQEALKLPDTVRTAQYYSNIAQKVRTGKANGEEFDTALKLAPSEQERTELNKLHLMQLPELNEGQREQLYRIQLDEYLKGIDSRISETSDSQGTKSTIYSKIDLATGDVISSTVLSERDPRELSESAITEYQKTHKNTLAQLESLTKLENEIMPEFFTIPTALKGKLASWKARLWDADFDPGKTLKDRDVFFRATEEAFNQYRREITGAQASDIEIERLRKAYIDRNLSYWEYKARLKALIRRTEELNKTAEHAIMTKKLPQWDSKQKKIDYGYGTGEEEKPEPGGFIEQYRQRGR